MSPLAEETGRKQLSTPFQVLMVDDTKINLDVMSVFLKSLGTCQEFPFTDPLEALIWSQSHDVHLVLVDYMMPGLDGVEFVKRFRSQPTHASTPIVMVTANDQRDVRYAALENGVTDFLTKPVDRVEFVSRMRNMLALEDNRRKLADRAAWLGEEVRKATQEIHERERETVVRLSRAAEHRDQETGAHVLRMAHFSEAIARQLGLPEADCELLLDSAPMHDIGKVGIPDNILLKAGKLDGPEFEVMKTHTAIGYEILKGSHSKVLQAGAQIAYTHHEKFDGSGYPNGLSGADIPLFSRIVAVADVFDALTSSRPYKPAWDLDRAVTHMNALSGTQFDPACLAAFAQCWPDIMRIRERFSDDNLEPS